MKQDIVRVQNVMRFGVACARLAERADGVPGIAAVYGFTGAGKTTATAKVVNQVDGIYLRATAVWTPNEMLGCLVHELQGQRGGSNARQLRYIFEKIKEAPTPRSIFVDEADYLLADKRMLETLRDVHDETGAPVIVIGMAGFERKLSRHPQFARRVTEWVEFFPLNRDDADKVCKARCSVKLTEGLVDALFQATGGSIGLMTVGLARVQQSAKSHGWDEVSVELWGNKPFYIGHAPKS